MIRELPGIKGCLHVKIMMNQEEREERVVAQVRRERIESEKGSGNVDMSTDSGGADKSTQTTDNRQVHGVPSGTNWSSYITEEEKNKIR